MPAPVGSNPKKGPQDKMPRADGNKPKNVPRKGPKQVSGTPGR